MPNKLLRTLTIDGVPNDTLGVGDYLELDTDNNAKLRTGEITGNGGTATLAHNTALNRDLVLTPVAGLYFVTMNATFAANANGSRYITPLFNGSARTGCSMRMQAPSTGTAMVGASWVGYLGENVQIGVRISQNSGGNLNLTQNDYKILYIPKVGGGNP